MPKNPSVGFPATASRGPPRRGLTDCFFSSLLARMIHERSSRNRRVCVRSGQARQRGAQAYGTVRRAPRREHAPRWRAIGGCSRRLHESHRLKVNDPLNRVFNNLLHDLLWRPTCILGGESSHLLDELSRGQALGFVGGNEIIPKRRHRIS